MQSLIALYNTLRGIFWLEKGPQDLPTSYALTGLGVAAFAASRIGVQAFQVPFGDALIMGLVELGVTVTVIVIFLSLRGVFYRAAQMIAAFTLLGAVFSAAIIVALAIMSMVPDIPLMDSFVNVVTFPVMLVNVVINGHLFRESLSTNLGYGVLAALLLFFAVANLSNRFDPDFQPPAARMTRVTPAPTPSK
ncbi:MAG: hypothetical protein ACREWG_13230 [Gammaproteobacteria bacterium]